MKLRFLPIIFSLFAAQAFGKQVPKSDLDLYRNSAKLAIHEMFERQDVTCEQNRDNIPDSGLSVPDIVGNADSISINDFYTQPVMTFILNANSATKTPALFVLVTTNASFAKVIKVEAGELKKKFEGSIVNPKPENIKTVYAVGYSCAINTK